MAPGLIVDCDPGLDDALALLALAALPEPGVDCVTAVAGNAPVELTARNAAFVLERSGLRGTPVLAGVPGLPASPRHGLDGLGGQAGDARAPWSCGAVAELARTDATILATGPLTNLAAALPTGRLIAMGGSLDAAPEFNFAFDAPAAARVLSGGRDVTLVPLDITRQVGFDRDAVAAIGRAAVNPLVGALLDASLARAGGVRCAVHDAVALLALVAPELMRTARGRVTLPAAGRIRFDADPAGATRVVVALDAEAAAARLAELWTASPR